MDERKQEKPAGGTAPLTVEKIAGNPPPAPPPQRRDATDDDGVGEEERKPADR